MRTISRAKSLNGNTTAVETGRPKRVLALALATALLRWPAGNFWRLRKLVTLAACIAFWELASRSILPALNPRFAALMPPPSSVLIAGAELVINGVLFKHLLASLKRTLVASLLAGAIAVPLGIAMGWWPAVYEQLDPVIELLRPVPPLSWIPLSILWFGIGDTQNQFIIFLGAFFPILVNTIAGVRAVEPNLIRAARCLGAEGWTLLYRVVFKAALPYIVTGIRIGLGVGWMCLVAAELVGAASGLGFLINDARNFLRTDIILVGMATIGVMGLTMDRVLRLVIRRAMPWYRGAVR